MQELISLDSSDFFSKLREDLDDAVVKHTPSQAPAAPAAVAVAAAAPAPVANQQTRKPAVEKKDVSSLLAQKLLAGWCMLGIHCPMPGCGTPLMRSKEGEMWCEQCQLPVMREADVKTQTPVAAAAPAPACAPEPAAPASPVEAKDPADIQLPRAEQHQDNQWELEDYDMSHLTERNSAVDAVSDKLGKYMLQGWTLLDIHCSVNMCCCPLVKSRDGEMVCAACGTQYMEEDDDDEPTPQLTDKEKEQASKPAAKAPVPEPKQQAVQPPGRRGPAPTAAAVRISRPDWSDEDETEEDEPAPAPTRRQPFRPTAAAASATSTAPMSSSYSSFSAPQAPPAAPAEPVAMVGVSAAQQALMSKLTWAQHRLTASSSVAECRELAKLMTELAEGVSAVRQLQR